MSHLFSSIDTYQPTMDTASSIVSSSTTTDIQESIVSSQSDHHTLVNAPISPANSSSLINNIDNPSPANHDNYNSKLNTNNNKKKNLRTEYKSNFTPFDQYVYNEVTDSFVKAQNLRTGANHGNQLSVGHHGDRSGSNQDLSGKFETNASPVLEVSSFEPLNGGSDCRNTHNEPWYKEVIKRNEKANEYRFKSEVGHSSPLLKTSNENLQTSSSPCGNDLLAKSDQPINSDQTGTTGAVQHSIRFTPNDYKRDHLIAYMANNNNFNLPKDHDSQSATSGFGTKPTSSSTVQSRRAQALNNHSAAQIRARSQSSRRQPTAATVSTTKKVEPASRSNQTTPTKTVQSRTTPTGRVTSSTTVPRSRVAAASSTRASKPQSAATKSTTNGAMIQNGAPTTTNLRRTAPSSASAASRAPGTMPGRITASSRPTTATTKPLTSSRVAPRAPISTAAVATTTTRPSTTSRTPTAISSTPRVPLSTPRSPIKRTVPATTASRPATARRTAPTTSRPKAPTNTNRASTTPCGSTAGQNGQSTNQSASNEVKSIKTPKAIASANAKAAAALASTVATGVAIAASTNSNSTEESCDSNPIIQLESHQQIKREEIQVQDTFAIPQEEQNLIFTTTEAGNMLADEIAQAEKEANEASTTERSKQESQIVNEDNDVMLHQINTSTTSAEKPAVIAELLEHAESVENDVKVVRNSADQNLTTSAELVNGLAGGLVSAEDRFDSSEHDASLEQLNKTHSESKQEIENQQINEADMQGTEGEPYSIMPTEYEQHEEEHLVESSEHLKNFRDDDDDEVRDQEKEYEAKVANEASQDSSLKHDDLGLDVSHVEEHDRFKTMTLHDEHQGIGSGDEFDRKDPELDDQLMNVEFETKEKIEDNLEKSDNQEALEDFRDKFSVYKVKEEEVSNDNDSESVTPEIHEIIKEKLNLVDPNGENSDFDGKLTQDDHQHYGPQAHAKEFNDYTMETSEVVGEIIANDYSDEVKISSTGESQSEISHHQGTPLVQTNKTGDELFIEDKETEMVESASSVGDLFQEENDDKKENHQDIEYPKETATMALNNSTSSNALSEQLDENLGELESKEQFDHVKDKVDLSESKIEPTTQAQFGDLDHPDFAPGAADTVAESSELQTNTNLPESDKNAHIDGSLDDQNEMVERHNELLMNVTDLIDVEARRKQEMARKSELARQQRGSLSFSSVQREPHDGSEILLSADQLNDQFVQLSTEQSSDDNRVEFADNFAHTDVAKCEQDKKLQHQSDFNHDVDEINKASDAIERINTLANNEEDDVAGILIPIEKESGGASEIVNDQILLGDSKAAEHDQQVVTTTDQETDDLLIPQSNDLYELNEGKTGAPEFDRAEELRYNKDNKELTHNQEVAQDNTDSNKTAYLIRQESEESVKENNSAKISHQEIVTSENTQIDRNRESESVSKMNSSSSAIVSSEIDQTSGSPRTGYNDMLADDIDSDEHLKLSNHLTNSDDEFILDPRATATTVTSTSNSGTLDPEFSPQRIVSASRYNEGAGLGLLVNEERVEADSAELADGSSAAIVTPTVAEKRVEEANSKLTMAELPQHPTAFIQSSKLIHEEQSDDDDDFVLDPDANPIDVAATMSPSSSVAEEMLRLSRENSNPNVDVSSLNSPLSTVKQEIKPSVDSSTTNSSSSQSSVRALDDNNLGTHNSQSNSDVGTTITITKNDSDVILASGDVTQGERNNNNKVAEENVTSKDVVSSQDHTHSQTSVTKG